MNDNGGTAKSPCVAVIDEDVSYAADNTQDWIDFRAKYPNRPFCLLIPYRDDKHTVTIPDEALTDPNFQVHTTWRNDGVDDWFKLCGLDKLEPSKVTSIGLFIDNKSIVKESYYKFVADAAEANIDVCEVYDSSEDWIGHFSKSLAPGVLSCIGPTPVDFTCPSTSACSCVDDDKCTLDVLDPVTKKCSHEPVTCAASNEKCDPIDG